MAAQVFLILDKQIFVVINQIPELFAQILENKSAHADTQELFYNFKKDVKNYLGIDIPSRMHGSNLSITDEDHDIPLTFRHVLEKITNPLDLIPNHHFQPFLTHYTKRQLNSGRVGVISLYGYVQTSPAVYDIYLAKARSQDPSFYLTNVQDNAFFFTQLIDFVFFPPVASISQLSKFCLKRSVQNNFLLHLVVDMLLISFSEYQ